MQILYICKRIAFICFYMNHNVTREANWDYAKTVLMFFILLGHLCPSNPDTWTPMTRVIGLFAIPLFFFISGFFQTAICDFHSLVRKYKKVFFRIIVPLLSWGAIYVILSAIVYLINLSDVNLANCWQFFKYTPLYILGFYWFLTALFFCQIIGSVISVLLCKRKVYAIWILIASFPLFCMLPPTFFERYHFSFIWLFYGLGMLYKQLQKDLLLHPYGSFIQLFIASVTIVGVYLGTLFMPQDTFYFKSNLVVNTSVSFIVKRYALYTLISILMLYWMMQIYRRYKAVKMVKTIASCGIDTLFIYCSHMLFLDFVYKPYLSPLFLHDDSSVFTSIGEHVFGILLSFVLYCGLQALCSYSKRFRQVRVCLMGC